MKITFDIPDDILEEVVQVLEYPQSVIPRADCSDKELVALDTVSAFREQIVADYNKGYDDNKADGNFK